jgi:hypothetical protein
MLAFWSRSFSFWSVALTRHGLAVWSEELRRSNPRLASVRRYVCQVRGSSSGKGWRVIWVFVRRCFKWYVFSYWVTCLHRLKRAVDVLRLASSQPLLELVTFWMPVIPAPSWPRAWELRDDNDQSLHHSCSWLKSLSFSWFMTKESPWG